MPVKATWARRARRGHIAGRIFGRRNRLPSLPTSFRTRRDEPSPQRSPRAARGARAAVQRCATPITAETKTRERGEDVAAQRLADCNAASTATATSWGSARPAFGHHRPRVAIIATPVASSPSCYAPSGHSCSPLCIDIMLRRRPIRVSMARAREDGSGRRHGRDTNDANARRSGDS